MTIDEIRALVASGESETLEFKSTTGARREAVETVCAMLNQKGGKKSCSASRTRETWRASI